MIRALLLAVLAAGAFVAWRLTRPQPEPEPPRWIEDEDGIQPADPRTTALVWYRGTYGDPAFRAAVDAGFAEHGWTPA